MAEHYDTFVIGAGANGTLAAKELDQLGEDVLVADPNGYGGNFLDQADSIGMDYMRSSAEHHVESSDPQDLYDFALEHGRDGEIEDGRPSLDLFRDHWDYIVEENDLDELLVEEGVENIYEDSDSYSIETENGEYSADNIVLATGKGPLNRPEMLDVLPDDAPAYHAFDYDFDVNSASEYDGDTYIVGSGATAGQVAKNMRENGSEVTVLSRGGIDLSNIEADEEWSDWDYVKDNLTGSPEERYEQVKEERNDGDMPEYLYNILEDQGVEMKEETEVVDVAYNGEGVDIELSDGESVENVQLIYATGFEGAYEDAFYQQLSDNLGMDIDANGMPVLDDETLEWQKNGLGSDIYVTGELAQPYLGPFAGNFAGAQMAADRLVETYEGSTDELVEEPSVEQLLGGSQRQTTAV